MPHERDKDIRDGNGEECKHKRKTDKRKRRTEGNSKRGKSGHAEIGEQGRLMQYKTGDYGVEGRYYELSYR